MTQEIIKLDNIRLGEKDNFNQDNIGYCFGKATFKGGLEYFSKEGFTLISTEEVIFLRTKIGVRNRIGHNIRVSESYIYYPSGEILITDTKNNPLIQMVSEGIDLDSRKLKGHCGYRLDNTTADKLMQKSRLEAHLAKETGVLLLSPANNSQGYVINTEDLTMSQITKFLFEESSTSYKNLLRGDKLKLKPNCPNPFKHLCDKEFLKGVGDYLSGKRTEIPYNDDEPVMPDWDLDLGGIKEFSIWAVPQTKWVGGPYNFTYACSSTMLSPMDPLWKADSGIDASNLIIDDYSEATMIGFRKDKRFNSVNIEKMFDNNPENKEIDELSQYSLKNILKDLINQRAKLLLRSR